MNPDELKRLGEAIARSLDKEGKPFFELKLQLGRLLSHLESEQRVTMNHDRQLTQHEKILFGDKEDPEAHPGIATMVFSMDRGVKRATKVLWGILGTGLSVLAVSLLKLMMKP